MDNPFFSFKRTKYDVSINSKILATFNGKLEVVIEAQNFSPLNYLSELRDIAKISKLFKYHEDKRNIINIF